MRNRLIKRTLHVLDTFETWRGRLSAASKLTVLAGVLLVLGAVVVKWLGWWGVLLILPGIAVALYGIGGMLEARDDKKKKIAEWTRRHLAALDLVQAIAARARKPEPPPMPIPGKPVPEHEMRDGQLVLRLRHIRLEGTVFRCKVRHPSGRTRSKDVDTEHEALSTKDHPQYIAIARYPQDFGRNPAPLEAGSWQVVWESLMGFAGPHIYEFDLTDDELSGK